MIIPDCHYIDCCCLSTRTVGGPWMRIKQLISNLIVRVAVPTHTLICGNSEEFLFLVWIFHINDILIIFSNCCSHTSVIMMPQCWQIYSDSYNIILFYTCMCYIPHSTCDGSDISCMYSCTTSILISERQDQCHK